jgi:cytochrome c-type biogenesis protein CcmH/NrfG
MPTLRSLTSRIALLTAILLPTLVWADAAAAKMLAEGRVDDAISTLQAKIKDSPRDAESYCLLCRAYYMVGDWDSGIAACEKAVALDAYNASYHSWLGRIYGEKADHAGFITGARMAGKVRTQFETAVRLNPDSVDARADLADFYLEAPGIVGGGKDKAEEQAQEISKLDAAQGQRVKARIAEQKKDYPAAEKAYRSAIELSGQKPGTWLNLAYFYSHVGRIDDMQDAIHHATAPAMNRPDLLMPAAELLMNRQPNSPEAAELLKRYLASGKTTEEAPVFKAHYLLGKNLEQNGDKQAAADQYREALALAKNFAPAREALDRLTPNGTYR